MRFLLDKNISYRVGSYITEAGLSAIHVDDVGLPAAPDVEILAFARAEGWIIVSSDTDFGTLLAAQRATSPSVILTREVSTLPAKQLADLVITNLPVIADDLAAGAMVAIGKHAIRIRRLPLR